MAITVSLSQKELERIAALAYEGETLKVMLCNVGTTNYTAENTVAEWEAEEISGNGYARFSATIATGSYNTTNGRYELPSIDAIFSAVGGLLDYDTIVLFIDGETYPHSVLTESPNIILLDGQTQTYRLSLNTDD